MTREPRHPALHRNHVTAAAGNAPRVAVFIHGFGGDQTAWRQVAPYVADGYRIVTYDLTGSGQSDLASYDYLKHGTLEGHASDLLELCQHLDIVGAALIGHSVGAMIALRAALRRPALCRCLVMIGASARYIDDDDYIGGFSRRDIDDMLADLERDFAVWSRNLAPTLMRNEHRPALADDLAMNFSRADPQIAKHFAKVTFLADHRDLVGQLAVPALILQCTSDAVVPLAAAQWLHRNMPGSELIQLDAHGHYAHISAPHETGPLLRRFLDA